MNSLTSSPRAPLSFGSSPATGPNGSPDIWSSVSRPKRGNIKRQRRLVVLGDSLVGKTAICHQYAHGKFMELYEPTYENAFSKIIRHNNKDVEVLITDTQGLDADTSLRHEYGYGYHGYVMVYSITSRRSLHTIKAINERLLNLYGSNKVPRVLVGNKSDLEDEHLREVSPEQGRAVAEEWDCPFTESSAKLNRNVDRVFRLLLEETDRDAQGATRGGWCDAILSCSPCLPKELSLTSAPTRRQAPRIVFASIVLVLLLGLFSMVAGLLIGVNVFGEAANRIAYVLFGFGLLSLLMSVVGLFGASHNSTEFLRVFGFSLLAIITGECVVWSIFFSDTPLLKHHLPSTLASFLVTILLQVGSLLCIWVHYGPEGRSLNAADYPPLTSSASAATDYFTVPNGNVP